MTSIEVRDAIHGLIPLSRQEWDVVDTAAFQRLRGVQQLAFTHLVYPGARHSRFEHCMGACHVAGRLAARLELDTANRVHLAALVHDIGHGPFSHVSEMVMEQLTGDHHIHERISAAIVTQDPAVRAALGDENAEWIGELLGGTGAGATRSVERDIVAGPADIDKLDYLLRDSHYCGVGYGKYDLDKIIEAARVATLRFGQLTALAFHQEGIFALEGMLLARYHMHRQVYGHRARVATDLMIIRAMRLAVDAGILPRDLFAPSKSLNAEYVHDYLSWDDGKVIETILGASGPSHDVMEALMTRRLYKRVVRWSYDDLVQVFGMQDTGFIVEPTDQQVLNQLRPDVEAQIAVAANIEPHWVTLHWEHLQNPISSRQSFRLFDKDILIVERDEKTETFSRASEVFGGNDLVGRRFISLYLRPKDDVQLSEAELNAVKTAALAGLSSVGTESGTL